MAKSIEQLERELAYQKSKREIMEIGRAKQRRRKQLTREIRGLKYGGLVGAGKSVAGTTGDIGYGLKVIGKHAARGFQKATRKGGYLDRLARQSAARKKGRRQSAFGIEF